MRRVTAMSSVQPETLVLSVMQRKQAKEGNTDWLDDRVARCD